MKNKGYYYAERADGSAVEYRDDCGTGDLYHVESILKDYIQSFIDLYMKRGQDLEDAIDAAEHFYILKQSGRKKSIPFKILTGINIKADEDKNGKPRNAAQRIIVQGIKIKGNQK